MREYQYRQTLSEKLLEDRIIHITTPIYPETVSAIIPQLLYLDSENNESISIYIGSPGGDVYTCMALHDTMKFIKSPVCTLGMGMVASAAQFLLTSGEKGKRFAFSNTKILMHQPWSGGIQGQTTDILIQAREMEQIRDMMYGYTAKYSGQDLETIKRDAERDKYMTAIQAKEYGLIDHVISSKDDIIAILTAENTN